MGIVFRQSVKTALVLFLGALLGAIVLWLSTKYVPKQEYGFQNNFTRWALLLSVLTPVGLTNTLSVYIHKYAQQDPRRNVLLTLCFSIPLFCILIFCMFYYLAPGWIIHHFQPEDQALMSHFFGWLPIYTLLFVYMTIYEQYLCSNMRIAAPAFVREIVLRILNIFLIFLLAFGIIRFNTFFVCTILLYMLPVLVFHVMSVQKGSFKLSLDFKRFSEKEYQELFQFTGFHYLLNISIMLMGSLDSLLIPFYDHRGFSIGAVYSVAVYFISLMNMPYKAFIQSSFAAMVKAFLENNAESSKDLFVRSSVNLLIPTVGLAVILCCNLENAVSVIGAGKNYADLAPVFLILLIGQLVNIATGMNDQVLSIANYYRFNFLISLLISGILFALIRVLVPVYGIFGAAWASTAALVLYNIIKFLFIWKKLDMQPFSRNTLLIFLAALPALAAGYFFPYFFNPDRHVYIHTFIDATLRSLTIMVVYVGMLVWLKPSRDLETYLAGLLKNRKLF